MNEWIGDADDELLNTCRYDRRWDAMVLYQRAMANLSEFMAIFQSVIKARIHFNQIQIISIIRSWFAH